MVLRDLLKMLCALRDELLLSTNSFPPPSISLH